MKRSPLKRGKGLERKAPLRSTSGALRGSEGLSRGIGRTEGPKRQTAGERAARPCEVCGEIFVPRWGGRAWTRSCSESCARELRVRSRRKPPIELTCEVCGARWTVQPSQAAGRRTCSLACAAEMKRREGGGTRKGSANPNHRHGKRAGLRDRAGERRWYAALGTKCAAPGCTGERGRLALHHVVYRQAVEREGGDPWDPRNAFSICNGCHARHHHRTRAIPLSALPDTAYEFARELLGPASYDYLRRRYSGDDPRLDALLVEV